MIQDLTPIPEEAEDEGPTLEDDPSGMSIPRTEIPIAGKKPTPASEAAANPGGGAQMGGRGKEKSNSIKAMAKAMAAAREREEATIAGHREPPSAKTQRVKSRRIEAD
jgi:hypothetical protein